MTYLLIRFPDGREGAVLEADLANADHADNFKGATIQGYEDGSEWSGPTTAEGMVRRAEREAEERREARRERAAARETAREAEAEPAAEAKE